MSLGMESKSALRWLIKQPEYEMPCTRCDFLRHYGNSNKALLHGDDIIKNLLSYKYVEVSQDPSDELNDRISLTQPGREYFYLLRIEWYKRVVWDLFIPIVVSTITAFLVVKLGP